MSTPNRLVHEQSPYLLQHAYNPVNWYPWGEEAFEKASKENKPIFLSIGYSTCHWCHMMEKESFEDDEVANLMNDWFVSIKVDREERPDVDGIYMSICQMITGSGGWPLTIVMTPEKKPFFAGTYLPKFSRYGRAGIMELLPKLNEIWRNQKADVISSAEQIYNAVNSAAKLSTGEPLTADILHKAFEDLSKRYDHKNGGFGSAPKFPTSHNLCFLMRYWTQYKNEHALLMVENTLEKMRFGGIYDQLGFGFHRYSTDAVWLIPHFEKMLYDQALTAVAYLEAFQITKKPVYEKTVREILRYVMRDMKSPEGAFYSAEDADSEGEEGKFYLWMIDEIQMNLNEDADLFIEYFNCASEGNWFDQAHGGQPGTNILHIKQSLEQLSKLKNIEKDEVAEDIFRNQQKLFKIRESRIHPLKDDKILTDWNSLMISAFAKAAQVFNDKNYIGIAQSAAAFILNNMRDSDGRLLHRYRNKHAEIKANIDDYAFFIDALLDLYEATFDVEYLSKALNFQNDLNKYFWDKVNGGFFFAASDGEKLLLRQKEIYDGAVPSGNSVAFMNLNRLYRFTGDSKWEAFVVQIVKTFSNMLSAHPSAFTQFLAALSFNLNDSLEIVLVGNSVESTNPFLELIREKFIPNKVVICKNRVSDDTLSKISEFTKLFELQDETARVFICKNFSCKLPITTMEELKRELTDGDLSQ